MPKGIYKREKELSRRSMHYSVAKKRGLTMGTFNEGAKDSKPTEKQKKAVKAFLEHPDDPGIENLKRAGYVPNPNSLSAIKGSRGFQEILNERVPDDKLARLISEGLSAEKPPAGFEDFVPDWGNRFKFVELVAKLKGYNVTVAPTVQVQFTNAIPRPKAEPIEGEVVD